METRVKKEKVVKTQTNEQKVLNYLNKTSRHLFINDKGEFYKVMPIKVKDKWYAVALTFNGTTVTTMYIDIQKYIGWYDNNVLSIIKHELFYGFSGKAIRNFKLMKEKMLEVNKYLVNNYGTEITVIINKKLTEILNGLTPKE